MTENPQSFYKRVIRLNDIYTIQLDSILIELLFKINEDALTIKKTSYGQNISANHKTQNHSQSVKLGSNANRSTNVMRTLQNPRAGYVDLPRFEENGRNFVIAEDTFKNKIKRFGIGQVDLVYNSMAVLYNLISIARFFEHIHQFS